MTDLPCALMFAHAPSGKRAHVHRLSEGTVGYLHVPDMERHGFSEFHRHWAAERAYRWFSYLARVRNSWVAFCYLVFGCFQK